MSKMSSLEKVVSNLLSQANFSYEREKIFKDCYNGLYRYDFYLPEKNALLEVQGQQHYIFTKKFYKNKSEFLKAQERDRRKIRCPRCHRQRCYAPYPAVGYQHSACLRIG